MRTRLLSACRPSASDAFLARRAAAGDDDAFEKLYARYQPRLQAYCRSIVRHDEDARDAVQNAMTKALVALRRQDGTTNVGGWLFRIAHNEAISLLRRRRPKTELPDVMRTASSARPPTCCCARSCARRSRTSARCRHASSIRCCCASSRA